MGIGLIEKRGYTPDAITQHQHRRRPPAVDPTSPQRFHRHLQAAGRRPRAGDADGLRGDAIVNTRHHGGPDQAVYVYGGRIYTWWAAELGRALDAGHVRREPRPISDLESAPLAMGDRLHVGAVILEVTAPRIPCWKLAQRMGDPGFVKRFHSGRAAGDVFAALSGKGQSRPAIR